MATNEHSLPAQINKGAARKAEGFATPKEDKKPQCARFPPTRVLPIIFLPGIMGSNLRLSEARRRELGIKDNIAWRPDSLGALNIKKNSNSPPRERQLRLDPLETSVDIYEPAGPSDFSGDARHENVKLNDHLQSPTLIDDPAAFEKPRTTVQKARARGWGEVFFGSYGVVLQHLESRLNNTFSDGKLRKEWGDVIGRNPAEWSPHTSLPQQIMTESELKEIAKNCWFAVHAFGYNWLQSNGDSANIIADRIKNLVRSYREIGYECNQVIIVTHSMGGLVGRALVHPGFGNLQDVVLGIVHGVMPAIGAPAAYKRMRAGFEDVGMIHGPVASLSAKVAGNYGDEVTAVLANAPGALQLLPTGSYGNAWLRVRHNGIDLGSGPKQGDPYNEIYKLREKWYALFREEWINPSHLPLMHGGGTFDRTCDYLDKAQAFHKAIENTFHSNSYAHYGADPKQRSFGEVVWEIDKGCIDTTGWQDWTILLDSRQGTLTLVKPKSTKPNGPNSPIGEEMPPDWIPVTIQPPLAPGDQTVPSSSADYQLNKGAFKGVFRQLGYEHQSSYNDPIAIASTLYSIVRIAQKAKWIC